MRCSTADLNKCYRDSENNLRVLSRLGTEKDLREAMKEHRDCEYALLYKNTDEYRRRKNKRNC